MPVSSWYFWCISAAIFSTSLVRQRVTVEPPKPPPVMRAPRTPPSRPISCARLAMRSNSGQETSKSSRREACEAAMRFPMLVKSPDLKAATASVVRAISVTTWRARRKIWSPISSFLARTSSRVTSRQLPLPRIARPSSVSFLRWAYSPSERSWETLVRVLRAGWRRRIRGRQRRRVLRRGGRLRRRRHRSRMA